MSRDFFSDYLGLVRKAVISALRLSLCRSWLMFRDKVGDKVEDKVNRERPYVRYGILLLPSFLAGCTRAPTFDIVGSFFPAWLICLFLGILLAVFARWLLLRLKVAIVLPILVYPSLAALFTFLLWLIFFS